MNDNFVTSDNIKAAHERNMELRNLLACMELAAANPDYQTVATELFPLASSLCDEVSFYLADCKSPKAEVSA